MTSSWATGQHFDIYFGDQSASVTELGAAIRAYGDADGPIIDGVAIDEPLSAGRGQVLMPWPNRVKDGRFVFDGVPQQLSITEVGKNNASHGLLRWVNWQCESHTESSVSMTYESHAQSGFPFAFDARITYTLSEGGLRVDISGRNTGPTDMPFGMGCHPYFTVGTDTVDQATLTCPADGYLPAYAQEIPTGVITMDEAHDYRTPRKLKDVAINGCWTQLHRDGDGIAAVDLTRTGTDIGLRVWMDAAFDYVMLFTGETVPQPERRRRSVAIEPMTCAPNAYNNQMGLVRLTPGETLAASWGVHRKSGNDG